jgi:hypothetical protein
MIAAKRIQPLEVALSERSENDQRAGQWSGSSGSNEQNSESGIGAFTCASFTEQPFHGKRRSVSPTPATPPSATTR